MNKPPILKALNIKKEFKKSTQVLSVLKNLTLEVLEKEALCITGPSGAGKSTFLHILGLLDPPSSGVVSYRGQNLSKQSEAQKAEFRRKKLGFVFQFHYLMSEFTAFENILIAGQIGGMDFKEAKEQALTLAQLMGIEKRLHHFPSELSGGEGQRTAMARALMNNPEILLVDEPTGNLDTKNSIRIVDILFELREKLGITLIAVSHDSHFSKCFPKILEMKDGEWQ